MDIRLRLRYFQSLKPCGLQKLIPNHQFSFCWIYLLLLTLLINRSSCPPSHHWTSHGFHFAGLNPISLVGLSRWLGEVSRAHQTGRGGSSGISSRTHPLLYIHASLGPIIKTHGFSYHCYADDTQLYLSFWPDDPTVAARISGCLADISERMKEHHLQLNWPKTLSLISSLPLQLHNMILPSSLSSSTIYPIKFGQKSWCNLRWPADFQRPLW